MVLLKEDRVVKSTARMVAYSTITSKVDFENAKLTPPNIVKVTFNN